jgi:hypothetical protein
LAAARAAVEAAVAAGGGEVMPELIFNPKKKVGSACFICRSMCVARTQQTVGLMHFVAVSAQEWCSCCWC